MFRVYIFTRIFAYFDAKEEMNKKKKKKRPRCLLFDALQEGRKTHTRDRAKKQREEKCKRKKKQFAEDNNNNNGTIQLRIISFPYTHVFNMFVEMLLC